MWVLRTEQYKNNDMIIRFYHCEYGNDGLDGCQLWVLRTEQYLALRRVLEERRYKDPTSATANNLDYGHSWYLSRLSRPAVVYFFFKPVYFFLQRKHEILAYFSPFLQFCRTFTHFLLYFYTGVNSVVVYKSDKYQVRLERNFSFYPNKQRQQQNPTSAEKKNLSERQIQVDRTSTWTLPT